MLNSIAIPVMHNILVSSKYRQNVFGKLWNFDKGGTTGADKLSAGNGGPRDY